MPESPFSSGDFASLDALLLAPLACLSVRSGTDSDVCNASRMAPVLALLGTTVGTTDGAEIVATWTPSVPLARIRSKTRRWSRFGIGGSDSTAAFWS